MLSVIRVLSKRSPLLFSGSGFQFGNRMEPVSHLWHICDIKFDLFSTFHAQHVAQSASRYEPNIDSESARLIIQARLKRWVLSLQFEDQGHGSAALLSRSPDSEGAPDGQPEQRLGTRAVEALLLVFVSTLGAAASWRS